MPKKVQLEDLARTILDTHRLEEHLLDVGYDVALPFRAAPSRGSDTLVIIFHGAVNRKKRPYPAFGPYIKGLDHHAHQVAFSDPTLAISDNITISWFAGSSTLPLQSVLVSVIRKLVDQLGIARLIFVGGSGGGFAAMYYSWYFPKSTAVAFSPQTIIDNYGQRARDRYYDVAWPEGIGTGASAPVLDLRELYGTAVENTVIYLQSYDDRTHLYDQMIPLLGSISSVSRARIISHVSYWGKPGHSGSVPLTEVARWVHSVVAIEEPCAENMRDAYYASILRENNFTAKTPIEMSEPGTKAMPQSSKALEYQRLADRLALEILNS